MDIIDKAKKVATKAHRGIQRNDGEDYINHPMRVAADIEMRLGKECLPFPLDYVIAAAWLHDVVEDTDLTLTDLRNAEFPEEVVVIIDHVTRRKDRGETYFDFIERCLLCPPATWVKQADLLDNGPSLSEGSLKDKYRFAYWRIKGIRAPF